MNTTHTDICLHFTKYFSLLTYIILYVHRLALDKAFKVLATEDDTNNSTGVTFYDFLMFMHYYQPWTRKYASNREQCMFHSDT